MSSFALATLAWSGLVSSSPEFARKFVFQHPSSVTSGGTCPRKALRWLDLGSVNHYSQMTTCSGEQHLLSQNRQMGWALSGLALAS